MRKTSFATCILGVLACTASPALAQGAIRGTVHGPSGADLSAGVVFACYAPAGTCDNTSAHSKFVQIGSRGPSAPFEIMGLARGQYVVVSYVDSNGSGTVDEGDLVAFHAGLDGTPSLVAPPFHRLELRLVPMDASVAALFGAVTQEASTPAPAPASPPGRGSSPPRATRPPPGRALEGIYIGVRLDAGVVNQYGYTLIDPSARMTVFFPDGRTLRSAPHHGFQRPVDWSRACAASADYLNPCGTYEIQGDEVHVRWEVGYRQVYRREGDELIMLHHHWDDTSPRSRAVEMVNLKRTPAVDGLRLQGRYANSARPNAFIAFTLDGRFTEQGLIEPLLSAGLPWDEFNRREELARRVPRGAGTYSVNQHTLELRYDNGLVFEHLLYLSPHEARGPHPSGFSLGNVLFNRTP
jgi:hypothetical protein